MDDSLKNTKLGWVGLGVMGEPMCAHLLAAGFPMTVTTRTSDKAQQLLRNGAIWADTPSQVVMQSDVIFTMVGSADEIEQVYFSDHGLLAVSDLNAKVIIDMGTTAPAQTGRLAQAVVRRSAYFVDAPVSGGDVGAKNATLSIMAGADETVFQRVKPLFDHLGTAGYMGGVTSGQHTKMCNQIVVAGTMIGVCESLLYAMQSGLDCDKMLQAIRPGAAGCWTLDNLAPRILDEDFDSGFMVDHFIKDLGIALAETRAMGLTLPGLALAESLYKKVGALGHGRRATQALLLALQVLSDGQR